MTGFPHSKILISILLLTVGFASGWYAYQIRNLNDISKKLDTKQEEAGQYVGNIYKNMNADLYASIQEKDFIQFAIAVIEKRCPFYIPDGITYRECLSDWEEELANKSTVGRANSAHSYCSTFVEKYTDETSLEGTELFLKCSIYKLQN